MVREKGEINSALDFFPIKFAISHYKYQIRPII